MNTMMIETVMKRQRGIFTANVAVLVVFAGSLVAAVSAIF